MKADNDIFNANLMLVDTQMSLILGNMLENFYRGKANKVVELTNLCGENNICDVSTEDIDVFYAYKVKELMTNIALGMMPASRWNGNYEATGGYIIVMAKRKVTNEMKVAADLQLKELQKQIEYDTKDLPVELLVDKFLKGDFFVPNYQRQFIWKPKNKDMFIESVLLGLPIPFMFFGDCEDGRMEVIDGAQRMQTLVQFVENKLTLSNLEKLTTLKGFSFKDLTEAQQRKFLNKYLRVVVLDEDTTNDVRQDLFNRINTRGEKANDSEIRRGSYTGRLCDFIEVCSKDEAFIK